MVQSPHPEPGEELAFICNTVPAIAEAWVELNCPPPSGAQVSFYSACVLEGCNAIPFATLKTRHGLRALCLTHFVALEEAAGIGTLRTLRRHKRPLPGPGIRHEYQQRTEGRLAH